MYHGSRGRRRPDKRLQQSGWRGPEYGRSRAAMTTADTLPEDMPGLRATALALIAERDELLRRIERMHHIIRQFQRAQFGRHSERLAPDQLQLALEEREIAPAHEQAAAEKPRA